MSRRSIASLFLGIAVIAFSAPAWAGGRFGGGSAVGGVVIDAEGVLRDIDSKTLSEALKRLRESMDDVSPAIDGPVKLRKISLRKLQAAISDAISKGKSDLPDEIKYLAGIQRIQYVFVYPESNDIVIAGPGEGWKVSKSGDVVGKTTGKPVIRLDDLLVAMRYVHSARTDGISCSIDPTEEGSRKLQQLLNAEGSKRSSRRNIPALEVAMKRAFGPQQVKFTGVPTSSHFARVLLAADYRMKRYGMNLEPAPVAGLPSYVQMMSRGSGSSPNPRWWMACNYDAVARSKDDLAWEIRNPGVKVMTEDEFVDADGKVSATGKASPLAKQWADRFTEKYAELSQKDPVFAELQNIMDLCVMAAIIENNDLLGLASLDLDLIRTNEGALAIESYNSPRTISPHCSFLRTKKGLVVTASGGVQVESWQVANNTTTEPKIALKRESLGAGPKNAWWWN
jgi:hypothetical protein